MTGYLLTFSRRMLVFIGVLALGADLAAGATEKVLYSFQGGSDASNPTTGVIADQAGNLYGTTAEGGAHGWGAVFEVSPPASQGGAWTETVLYSFQGGSDGGGAMAGLAMDSAGNLYGTTLGGGSTRDGVVFQLAPPATQGEAWTETVIHTFTGSPDGEYPVAPMIFDSAGNLYGTTVFGGAQSSLGTVFQLTPPSSQGGAWAETVLYRFTGGSDGLDPESGLIMDRTGALYGTTDSTVYKLTPPQAGHIDWTLKVLFTFGGGANRGAMSAGTLLGGAGTVFYDTQKSGGSSANAGSVFQLTRNSQNGTWSEAAIHKFTAGADGAYPHGGMIADSAGNLYGTASGGGTTSLGTVFKLIPPGAKDNGWTEVVLHTFQGGTDGSVPGAPLIFGKGGALYGTTGGGGASNLGTVFQIIP